MSRHPHLGRVLVKQLTVIEDELSVRRKVLTAAVSSLQQALSHGEEVHGVFDDAPVAGDQPRVDWFKERPGVSVSLHLHQDDLAEGEIGLVTRDHASAFSSPWVCGGAWRGLCLSGLLVSGGHATASSRCCFIF